MACAHGVCARGSPIDRGQWGSLRYAHGNRARIKINTGVNERRMPCAHMEGALWIVRGVACISRRRVNLSHGPR